MEESQTKDVWTIVKILDWTGSISQTRGLKIPVWMQRYCFVLSFPAHVSISTSILISR